MMTSCTSEPPSPRDMIVRGPVAWNEWREKNPEIEPDLSGMLLDGADLRLANLNGARLKGASLRTAQLNGASFVKADLSGADLREANLDAADLSEAILRQASLEGATLNHCTLAGANLSEANVRGAHLSFADLSNATVDQLSNWRDILDMRDCNIYRIIKAPGGFKEFALGLGARKDG